MNVTLFLKNMRLTTVEKKNHFRKGLSNVGNSCFFNATVQSIFHLDLVFDYFYQDRKTKKYFVEKALFLTNDTHEVFQKFLHEMVENTENFLNSQNFYEKIKNLKGIDKGLFNHGQQDAQEFLLNLFKVFNQDVQKMFHFDLEEKKTCTLCKNVITINQKQNLMLGLHIPKTKKPGSINLQKILEIEMRKKTNSFIQCKNCENVLFEDEVKLKTFPFYLILFLFRYDESGNKINRKVKVDKLISFKNESSVQTYIHVATIHHTGDSLSYGHYTADVRIENDLYTFNDENVEKQKEDKGNAYLIFYKIIGT